MEFVYRVTELFVDHEEGVPLWAKGAFEEGVDLAVEKVKHPRGWDFLLYCRDPETAALIKRNIPSCQHAELLGESAQCVLTVEGMEPKELCDRLRAIE